MISTMHEALIAEQPTEPLSALPKTTRKLYRVQFVTPPPMMPPAHLNVLDVHLRIDAVQRTLLTKLLMQGGSVTGTLDQLHERLKMPVTQGDLRALFEQGYISLGVHAGVWHAEVRRP